MVPTPIVQQCAVAKKGLPPLSLTPAAFPVLPSSGNSYEATDQSPRNILGEIVPTVKMHWLGFSTSSRVSSTLRTCLLTSCMKPCNRARFLRSSGKLAEFLRFFFTKSPKEPTLLKSKWILLCHGATQTVPYNAFILVHYAYAWGPESRLSL
jgi:hypothetical protein